MRSPSDLWPIPAWGGSRKPLIHTSIQVGKYLITPRTQLDRNGHHLASVSIRSGRGSATHDRIVSFTPTFVCGNEAARFATERGHEWLSAHNRGAGCPFTQQG